MTQTVEIVYKQKPGYKSTEFYGHGAATILGAVAASGILNPEMSKIATDLSETAMDIVVVINSIVDGAIQLTGIIAATISQLRYGKARAIEKIAVAKRQ